MDRLHGISIEEYEKRRESFGHSPAKFDTNNYRKMHDFWWMKKRSLCRL